MVALVMRGSDDTPLAIHRTYLARDGGGKAPVDPQKMMLGPCRGGAVRLAAAGNVLMVGEGIDAPGEAAARNCAWRWKRQDRRVRIVDCRVTALDEAIAEENGTGRRGPTQADILLELAQSAELFHAPDGTGFARHREWISTTCWRVAPISRRARNERRT